MKICVYGSASDKISDEYKQAVEQLCFELAKDGHELVFGGGAHGLMGAAVRGFYRGGGKAYGVVPEFFKQTLAEALSDLPDVIVWTKTMHERKQKMEELADAFIVTPGGVGTFDEAFSIVTNKQLGTHSKPIAFFNVNGFFNRFVELVDNAVSEGFINEECKRLYTVTSSKEEIKRYLKSGGEKYETSMLKNG